MTTSKKPHTAATRAETRQISAHFHKDIVKAFRVHAARQDKDVQQLMAEAINLVFERDKVPIRAPLTSGRRKPAHALGSK